MRKIFSAILVLNISVLACSFANLATPQQVTPAAIMTIVTTTIEATTDAPTATPSPTILPSETLPPSPSPTASLTPTVTYTPGPSATPTFTFPSVTVNQQAHCRYGPNIAYLHAADLYAGDTGTVRGRYQPNISKWLFVKFDKLDYFCWVAPSVVDVVGDITTIKTTLVVLPGPSELYKPPQNVLAVRNGNKVTITWDMVPMTKDDDRGYFLDIFVCQGKAYLWYPVALDNREKVSFTIKDEAGCPALSGGNLYAVEKHGYTKPVEIKWPKPITK